MGGVGKINAAKAIKDAKNARGTTSSKGNPKSIPSRESDPRNRDSSRGSKPPISGRYGEKEDPFLELNLEVVGDFEINLADDDGDGDEP